MSVQEHRMSLCKVVLRPGLVSCFLPCPRQDALGRKTGELISVAADFYRMIWGRAVSIDLWAHAAFSLQAMDAPYGPSCYPMNGFSVTVERWEIVPFFPQGLFRFTRPKLIYFLSVSKSVGSLLACEPCFCYHMYRQEI